MNRTTLVQKARNANLDTPLSILRSIELDLLDDDSDDADMCLPHIESLILYKTGWEQ